MLFPWNHTWSSPPLVECAPAGWSGPDHMFSFRVEREDWGTCPVLQHFGWFHWWLFSILPNLRCWCAAGTLSLWKGCWEKKQLVPVLENVYCHREKQSMLSMTPAWCSFLGRKWEEKNEPPSSGVLRDVYWSLLCLIYSNDGTRTFRVCGNFRESNSSMVCIKEA